MTRAAARVGDLEALKRAHEHGCDLGLQSTVDVAVQNGHLEVVQYLCEHGCYYDPRLADTAVKHGHADCLRYVLDRFRCDVDKHTFDIAIRNGEVACLRSLIEHVGPTHPICDDLLNVVAYHGAVSCMDVLPDTIPWTVTACVIAVMRDHVDFLRYAVEHGYVLRLHMTVFAAEIGKVSSLAYLRTVGCVWDERVTDAAAKKGRHACLHYLHAHGCPVSEETRRILVTKVWLPMWRAHVRARGIFEYWRECAGRTAYAPDGEGRKRDREAYEADFA